MTRGGFGSPFEIGRPVRPTRYRVLVQRASYGEAAAAFVENVSVDHRGAYVIVAEEFLNRADVAAVLEKVSREAVPEGVASRRFVDAGSQDCLSDRLLQDGLM